MDILDIDKIYYQIFFQMVIWFLRINKKAGGEGGDKAIGATASINRTVLRLEVVC